MKNQRDCFAADSLLGVFGVLLCGTIVVWAAPMVAVAAVAETVETTDDNGADADDGQPEDAAGTRVLHFPEDRSLGTVYVMDSSLDLFPGLVENDDWFGNFLPWQLLSKAQANVTVPQDKRVKLSLSAAAAQDLSPLTRLGANDIQLLAFSWPRSDDEQIDDDDLQHLSELIGLEEIVIFKNAILGPGSANARRANKWTSILRTTETIRTAAVAYI